MEAPEPYEQDLLDIMISNGVTLREALDIDMYVHNIDTKSIYDMVDYLEEKLLLLDKVAYYMLVYTGQTADVGLKPI